jgi:5-methylcytosine-specific restriction endonuclease McrA
MTLRPCLHRNPDGTGCQELVEDASYCDEHQPKNPHHDPAYQQVRRRVLARDHHTCQRCGITAAQLKGTGKGLETHHLDGDPNNHAMANLVTACFDCHRKVLQPAVRKAGTARLDPRARRAASNRMPPFVDGLRDSDR